MDFRRKVNLTILVLALSLVNSTTSDPEPIILIELFRHGARTAAHNYLSDPFTTTFGTGNLTGNGERMHMLLGSQISQNPKYKAIFSSPPNPNTYLLYSSAVRRCIKSAQSHLLGLWPLGKGQKIHSSNNLTWLPAYSNLTVNYSDSHNYSLQNGAISFPVMTRTAKEDELFLESYSESCPLAYRNSKSLEAFYSSSFTSIVNKTFLKLKQRGFDSMKYVGLPGWTFEAVFGFFDSLHSYYYYYGHHYEGIDQDFFDELELVFSWYFSIRQFKSLELRKLWTTQISKGILKNFELNMNGSKPDLKYVMYSAHDSNVLPFMIAFNLTSRSCLKSRYEKQQYAPNSDPNCKNAPNFASGFLWELSQKDKNYYVRVFFEGDPVQFCDKTKVENGYCPYAIFEETMNSTFLLKNFTAVCGNASNVQTDVINALIVVVCLAGGIIVLLMIVVVCLLFKKSPKRMSGDKEGYKHVEENDQNDGVGETDQWDSQNRV